MESDELLVTGTSQDTMHKCPVHSVPPTLIPGAGKPFSPVAPVFPIGPLAPVQPLLPSRPVWPVHPRRPVHNSSHGLPQCHL